MIKIESKYSFSFEFPQHMNKAYFISKSIFFMILNIAFKSHLKEFQIIQGSSSFGYSTVNYVSANVSNEEKAAV